MGTMIPLGDASRRPLHRPVVTACTILINAFVFTLELGALTARLFENPRRLAAQRG